MEIFNSRRWMGLTPTSKYKISIKILGSIKNNPYICNR